MLLYGYDFEWKTEKFRNYGSYVPTGTVCTHSVQPFPIHYDHDFEWKTKNFRKYGSHVPTGMMYTHSVYTILVTM